MQVKLRSGCGPLSIGAFERGRWRLRRTRGLWVLNRLCECRQEWIADDPHGKVGGVVAERERQRGGSGFYGGQGWQLSVVL